MTSIAVAGHVCVDLAPRIGDTADILPGALVDVGPLAVSLGGCVANTARALAGLGTPVVAYAAVGDDALGRIVREQLETSMIDARVSDVAAPTSYSIVFEPSGADRTFWHHVGANALFDGGDVDASSADIVHLGYPSLLPAVLADDARPLMALLQRVREAGASVSVDLAVVDPISDAARLDWPTILRTLAPYCDVLTPSLDDLTSVLRMDAEDDADLAELFAELLISWGAAVVVISAGAGGLVMRTADARRLRNAGRGVAGLAETWANQALRAPALTVQEVRTTNGAGDASTAGILYAIAQELSPEQALRLATASSASVVSGAGVSAASILAFAPELAHMLHAHPRPVVLPANQPTRRFYRGGEQISQFRDAGHSEPFTPEDWVGSTVSVRNEQPSGLTTLPGGGLLKDAIASDPCGWLGPAHVERYGDDPMILVKILDAGQRLPVHAHPDGAFAARHLGTAHGKAEAWHILTPGVIYLGLRRDVEREELATLVHEQRVEDLLDLLNRVDVNPGDRVFVPPGVMHAIGEGVLLLEVQEPEDLSILLEWRDFEIDGATHGHLGLGFDFALDAVDLTALDPARLAELVLPASTGPSLPAIAERYFRLDRIDVDGVHRLASEFSVVVGLEGSLRIPIDQVVEIGRGTTALIPAAAGPVDLVGTGSVLVARPPAADR
ncbi:PfkB family carbohydrate kinase [Microbacterium sp. ABRD28]|uniref:PfkB family carbohydrate kinase n=1 Tax=Microbacterium sp. ABRD28 TaxID=2268461 RepID=UPI0013DDD0C6|nr:PfkB family carbohydrate kinase [Microbacterium sp. ABRD28]